MAGKKKKNKGPDALIRNSQARRNYHIIDTYESGIELRGTEVKSLRARRANLTEAFARVRNNEVWLYNLHISPYEQGNRNNHDPLRSRRLLLHKREIATLVGATEQKGMALVPLRLYLKKGRVKVELALAEGKMKKDKREDLKKKEHRREITHAVSRVQKR
jgi:SsrA-binding protein